MPTTFPLKSLFSSHGCCLRFDFSSPESITILEEKENKKNESVKRMAKGSGQEGKRQKTENAVRTGAKQKLRI